ncbi:MAG: hypothetical protein HFI12_02165 [Lachnospiraceae bacterium]|jgi:hypothetical protein|nr:hypothetical protein [Lachnospiraceae bacterium]
MKRRVVKGMVLALCLTMLAPAVSMVAPGAQMVVSASQPSTEPPENKTEEQELEDAKKKAQEALDDWKLINLKENDPRTEQVENKIQEAKNIINGLKEKSSVEEYVKQVKDELNALSTIINPPIIDDGSDDDNSDDDNTDDEEEDTTVTPDHFLMVGGDWVTPVANAGQSVNIVLPVVNMGKTMVTNAVVTPVLSTDTSAWPFEITSSNYSQAIADLPGTDTGMSDMDRRRELTWTLKTRDDVGTGYQKLSFGVRYRDSDGNNQTTTLDTYIQIKGSGGVGADGKASVPRVIVTGFETNPETVHAGESFMLTLHLKNTSKLTSLKNIVCEMTAAVEGKDDETTYAAFLPTAGSSTVFVDQIAKDGTKDIQIELEAKADLSQKPYALDVSMTYEDEKVNSYTNTTSVSIPVKQEARIDLSQPEVMPQNISVGSEANIMFSVYNMGKTKLYNVQVKTESEYLSGGSAFVGNLDSGATGSVDMYVTGQAATADDGTVKLLISYEDEAGEAQVIEKTINLIVSEAASDDLGTGDFIEEDMEYEEEGNSISGYIIAAVGILAIVVIVVVIIRKKKKKKAQLLLEDELLDDEENDDN